MVALRISTVCGHEGEMVTIAMRKVVTSRNELFI